MSFIKYFNSNCLPSTPRMIEVSAGVNAMTRSCTVPNSKFAVTVFRKGDRNEDARTSINHVTLVVILTVLY